MPDYQHQCPRGHRWNSGGGGVLNLSADTCPTCGHHFPQDGPGAVTVTLPGAVLRDLRESSWPRDCPSGWAEVERGTVRRRGRGTQRVVTLARFDAADLADYLETKADLLASMSPSERGPDGLAEQRRASDSAARLRSALA
jgi:hypothetical protein